MIGTCIRGAISILSFLSLLLSNDKLFGQSKEFSGIWLLNDDSIDIRTTPYYILYRDLSISESGNKLVLRYKTVDESEREDYFSDWLTVDGSQSNSVTLNTRRNCQLNWSPDKSSFKLSIRSRLLDVQSDLKINQNWSLNKDGSFLLVSNEVTQPDGRKISIKCYYSRLEPFSYPSLAFPDNTIERGWHLKDHALDGYSGISLEKAYALMNGARTKKVVVAVIDTGIDTLHEDLKDHLWANKKEIPGNGKDDDGNGYIDDYHGWNFLGAKDGRNVVKTAPEIERFYYEKRSAFINLKDSSLLTGKQLDQYNQWKNLNKIYGQGFSRNQPPDYRKEIIGDNPDDINDKGYGNADIMAGGLSVHGTHVSGIIGASRKNNKGIDGIAADVSIMMLRAVPDGDEYDKDIALAIRYAVDNGARIINMSFGKSTSPHKEWIDEAAQYAASKNVLLVQGAGNSHDNIDSVPNFPSPKFLDNSGNAKNWITVGASSDLSVGGEIIADYSNWGASGVNVFAPGSQIYSTVPGDKYEAMDGTSMAAPVVTGVAALLLSYYPDLTALELRYILETSAERTFIVNKPGSGGFVPFNSICRAGGIVNAYKALLLAKQLIKQKR